MKNKCKFVGIMFLCILIVCTLAVMAYEHTAGKTGAAGGVSNSSGNTKNTDEADDMLTVVTSFYPMYIATLNIVDGVEGVRLENLSEPQTGCLHDFQLTPEDMKLLSTADVFVINGGGIESFMSDVAKAYPKLDVVEACEDVALLSEDDADSDHDHDHDADTESDSDHDHDHDADTESDSDHDHDHEADAESDSAHDHDHGDENAHAWMSVPRYRTMVQTIASRLAEKDAKYADEYYANAKAYDAKLAVLEEKINSLKSLTNGQNIIIFHEAYAYVADDFSMNACYLLDLDEERSVSAGEIKQVIGAIKDDGVSVILAEELYGKSMGDTVSRETDVHVIYIDPLNRGEYDKDSYLDGMEHNIELIKEAFTK
ncbi:zinc ABC transporter substrate-binding protein [Agathobacter rectalis]|jgi:zinc transport system substrate-binding protein|uniref:Zinc ABC transporter substrate-binding protein n=1 Tax=Agathobacter rectalis TaxID=39491 RepID=A0A3E4X917_9FIRM|nr:metal ABC transporter substrate-binding protein [Agathobacter rectalis]RGM50949.1 zinc ABC transporter substrate-binding protein [Agathobacter rectalis]RGU26606.1 zinc ABC transporter substrate-binding protein [Agathobacter rectalis]RHD34642.1 zinc ABC transporter substrate-binding protein [Agathobacter rectalis]